jgi:hypothetical protein
MNRLSLVWLPLTPTYYIIYHGNIVGRDSSVGVEISYGLDGQGIEARYSEPAQTGSGAHPAFYTMDTGSFLGLKRVQRGVNHKPPSRAEVKEESRATPLHPPLITPCLRGRLQVELHLNLKENFFLFTPFWFTPPLSATQLGSKTRKGACDKLFQAVQKNLKLAL